MPSDIKDWGDQNDAGNPGDEKKDDGWVGDWESDDEEAYGIRNPAVFLSAWLDRKYIRHIEGDIFVVPIRTKTTPPFAVRHANHRAVLQGYNVSKGLPDEE